MILFLTLFLALLLIVIVGLLFTALMNLWIGVPSVPTPPSVADIMIDLAELKGNETVMDLGAGDGRLLIQSKKRYPGVTASGCEIIPTIWLIGKLRIFLSRQRIIFHCCDARKQSVKDADVLFLYLFPSLMGQLEAHFNTDLKKGARVVSHTFKFPGKTPVLEKKVKGYWGGTSVYLYVW